MTKYNQRQLNNGQQGSGSGLDADTVDEKDSTELSSELGRNVSLQEYRVLTNEILSDTAENSFEVGLQGLNFPDGLFDIFIDQSKIQTFSGTTISNRNIELVEQSVISSSVNANEGFNTTNTISYTFTAQTGNSFISTAGFEYEDDRDGGNGELQIFASGELIASTSFAKTGTSTWFEINLSSSDYSRLIDSGETVEVVIDPDSQFGVINSTSSTPSDTVDMTNFSGTIPGYDGSSGGTLLDYTSINYSDGSFVSESKDLGYLGGSVIITADYELNNGDLSFELQDSTGSTIKTISESEIGDVLNISTSATSYQVEATLTTDGVQTPVLKKYEVAIDNEL